ncbi:hypothetical protein M0802_007208 [Mischocyttarus mexicanus]|nr:hypothetical protein M0802_007208 [Mischocyttarus mexicanus]
MTALPSYLNAIQSIEGTKPKEKFNTIMKEIKNHINMDTKEIDPSIWDKTDEQLLPLYKLIISNMIESYDMVTDILKLEDTFIVSRALKFKWYFEGKNKDIINPKYFLQNILPFATTKTRREIAKSLGRYLKDTELAADFFQAYLDNYGLESSLTLFYACSDEFVKEQILKHKIILKVNHVNRLYVRKPNVILYYFDLFQSKHDDDKLEIYSNTVRSYKPFLPKLIKNHHECFEDVYIMWKYTLMINTLNNKYAKYIIQKNENNTSIMEENPKLYITLIRDEMIDETLMESIFPKLFPKDVDDFDTEKMFLKLIFYPSNKKYKLISESYEEVYGRKFIKDLENITFDLLPLMPYDLRIELLPRLKNYLKFTDDIHDYKCYYDSYLPTDNNFQQIRQKIIKCSIYNDRLALIMIKIYNCKINNATDTFCQFLNYILKNHKNERIEFWDFFFTKFNDIYNYSDLGLKEWLSIDNIIEYIYNQSQLCCITSFNIIMKNSILIKLHNSPYHESLKKMIDIYLDALKNYYTSFTMQFDLDPQDECMFFYKTIDWIEEKFTNSNVDNNSDTNLNLGKDSDKTTDLDPNLGKNSDKTTDLDPNLDSISDSNVDEVSIENQVVDEDDNSWNKDLKIRLIYKLIKEMYCLNKEYGISIKNKIQMKRILREPFIKWKSPWLWQQVEDILLKKETFSKKSIKYVKSISDCVKLNDPEIYRKLLGIDENVKEDDLSFRSIEPFQLLKNQPTSVLTKLKLFWDTAENERRKGKIKRFFSMCRWYENIPVKFLEEAQKRLSKDKVKYLYLLAFIMEGESYKKFIQKYFFNRVIERKLVDNDKKLMNEIVLYMLKGIQISNPPISMDVIDDLIKYDSMCNHILQAYEIVSVNTSLDKTRAYLSTFSCKKISIQRNVIRIFCIVETIEKCVEYLSFLWKKENSESIRQVIFQRSYKLFIAYPRKYTWDMLISFIKTYKKSDWDYRQPFWFDLNKIPIEYTNELIGITIGPVVKFILKDEKSKNVRDGLRFLKVTLNKLDCKKAEILDDKISLKFIEKYFFEKRLINVDIMFEFTIHKYFFVDMEKCIERMKIFGDIFQRIGHEWNNFTMNNNSNHVRKTIINFIEMILNLLMENYKENNLEPSMCNDIINELMKTFFKVPIYTIISSYIKLQLTKCYTVTNDQFYENFATIVVNELAKEKCSYPILVESIINFRDLMENGNYYIVRFQFIKSLLKYDKCSLSKMTAVELMEEPPKDIKHHSVYEEIFKQLQSMNDKEVFCLLYHKISIDE